MGQQEINTSLQHVACAPAATAWEVAGAVAYLHGEGIVHGDVCSSNVLLKVAQTQRGFITKVGQELQGQQLPDCPTCRWLHAWLCMLSTRGTVADCMLY